MKYHFIGDQGISMRGLKEYLRLQGNEVSGSDLKTGGHRAENITSDIDAVVRTSAVNPGSAGWAEVLAAEQLGIKVMKRSQLLSKITKDKRLIAVSGMHGKTTITAMAGLVLMEAGFDPTVLVGEEVSELDGVLRFGSSPWFVAEVCEYDRSFLDVNPEIIILINIEEEHLDTYPGGLPEIKSAFAQYLSRIKPAGAIIACADDKNVSRLVDDIAGRDTAIIKYGFTSPKYNHLDFSLAVPGKHNVLNSLAVVALADYLQIDLDVVEKVLTRFKGAKRRFEYKGEVNGAAIVDDYGHHPTEIRATIDALAERFPGKRRVVVFWPHQYKRIKPLLHEFAAAFTGADEVILKPIYLVPGRDEKMEVDSSDLANLINEHGEKAEVMKDDGEIIKYLRDKLNSDDVLLTIGIPPIYKVAEELSRRRP